MNIQNNVNFTGLYLKTTEPMAVSRKSINKLSQFLKERGGFINRLEKEENTDVFINEKFDEVSLKHKKYGEDIHKYIKPISISEFSAKNEENIVANLCDAVKKVLHDWEVADLYAKMHMTLPKLRDLL